MYFELIVKTMMKIMVLISTIFYNYILAFIPRFSDSFFYKFLNVNKLFIKFKTNHALKVLQNLHPTKCELEMDLFCTKIVIIGHQILYFCLC